MGYGTRYQLTASFVQGATPAEAIADLLSASEEAEYALEPTGETLISDAKWYEHQADLVQHSRKFPHLIFVLHGWGQENEDIWVKYFLNGRVQIEKAQLRLGGFDPSKLVAP